MFKLNERVIPLLVTVGQAVIFPYYIIWLKNVSSDYTIFAWLFAAFSFASAWGYKVLQEQKYVSKYMICIIYFCMSFLYLAVGCAQISIEILPYVALFIQVFLGFLQGYFRGYHSKQKSYHLNVARHYMVVGFVMVLLSFVKVISPLFFVISYGLLLFLCACYEWYSAIISPTNRENPK